MPAVKAPNTVRIFVLGESAAMGDPDFKFGLPRMVEVLLRERFPNRRIEAVNTAMVAINSHAILPIARDCAQRDGDLWILYMGNNEIIGLFGSASVFGARAPARPLVRAGLWGKGTRRGKSHARLKTGSLWPRPWPGQTGPLRPGNRPSKSCASTRITHPPRLCSTPCRLVSDVAPAFGVRWQAAAPYTDPRAGRCKLR